MIYFPSNNPKNFSFFPDLWTKRMLFFVFTDGILSNILKIILDYDHL